MPLSGREKATILLSILGTESSAKILRRLPDELADLIAAGVDHLPTPSPEALLAVLEDFNRYLSLPPSYHPEAAGNAAVADNGNKNRVYQDPKALLLASSPKKIALNLVHERPQLIAFIVSLLPAGQAADVMAYLPEQRKEVESLLRDIKKIPLSNKIESKVLETLAEKLRT